MSPYITFRENNSSGELAYYILQRSHPHYVFEIVSIPKESFFIQPIPVTGYYIWLNFNGVLLGEFIPSYKGAFEQIVSEMNAASQWFYENRILPNPKKYKKFKK
jgi:hypothetical protein